MGGILASALVSPCKASMEQPGGILKTRYHLTVSDGKHCRCGHSRWKCENMGDSTTNVSSLTYVVVVVVVADVSDGKY